MAYILDSIFLSSFLMIRESALNLRCSEDASNKTDVLETLSDILKRYSFNAVKVNRGRDPQNPLSSESRSESPELEVLIRLFLRLCPVSLAEIESILTPLSVQDLASAGLVKLSGDTVTPLYFIEPHDNLFVSSDAGPESADYVTRVTKAAETLSHLTVRRPIARALDMGTGSGVQALLAARHAEKVIATDLNPQALALTEMNARLNGLPHVECRQGSWFEPVQDESFDLIVCNPPYVISPDTTYLFRDAPGGHICRQLAGEIPHHLNPGGFATMLINWVHEGSWSEPLREWVEGNGCDVLLIHYVTTDCSEYAALWNTELLAKDTSRFEETVGRWRDFYRTSGIRWIASGAIVFRRSLNGRSRIRTFEATNGPNTESGDHIERLFAAGDFLDSIENDQDFLDYSYTLVDGHRIDQTIRRDKSQYIAEPAVLRIVPGMGLEAQIDARVLELLFGMDSRPLRKLVREIARSRGEDESAFADLAVASIRRLVELGFAVPGTRFNHSI